MLCLSSNQPYLSLTTPKNTPSPIQLHALKVLSCTFMLLTLVPPEPMFYPPLPHYNAQQQMPTINLNQHLQQLGFPGLRMGAQPNPNQNPADHGQVSAMEPAAELPLRPPPPHQHPTVTSHHLTLPKQTRPPLAQQQVPAEEDHPRRVKVSVTMTVMLIDNMPRRKHRR